MNNSLRELASSHISVRPSIQPEVATYRLLLDVITSTVGDDDIIERGALRDAINRRITFLADEVSLSSMSEEEVNLLWSEVCVLPEPEMDDEFEDSVMASAAGWTTQQKHGSSTSSKHAWSTK